MQKEKDYYTGEEGKEAWRAIFKTKFCFCKRVKDILVKLKQMVTLILENRKEMMVWCLERFEKILGGEKDKALWGRV